MSPDYLAHGIPWLQEKMLVSEENIAKVSIYLSPLTMGMDILFAHRTL